MFKKLFIPLLILCFAVSLRADNKPSSMQKTMLEVYKTYYNLAKFISKEQDFLGPKNKEEILSLIKKLRKAFHNQPHKIEPYYKDAGFLETIQELNKVLYDIEVRFKEGKKKYSYWRLKNISEYCISCHTRYKVDLDLSGMLAPAPQYFNNFERGIYYVVSRQYKKASDVFYNVLTSKDESDITKEKALYYWLLVNIVDLHASIDKNNKIDSLIKDLSRFKNLLKTKYLKKKISFWIKGLKTIKKIKIKGLNEIRVAEYLIKIGERQRDVIVGSASEVEFLYSASILHKVLKNTNNPKERAKALYLLGIVYSNLKYFYPEQLGQFYFESVIRENPGSSIAKKAYNKLYNLIIVDYTGSGGTHLPNELKYKLIHLRSIASGDQFK